MEELVQTTTSPELEELVQRVHAYSPEADTQQIRRAYDYSARMHGEQKRESGEPYVTHPLNVALIVGGSIAIPHLRRAFARMQEIEGLKK